jgi:hypothetical protein
MHLGLAMKALGLWFLVMLWGAIPLHAQVLDSADVRVTLDSALGLARKAAAAAFPELPNYLLYSIKPRILLADPGGLHWQVSWQEKAFPQPRWLVVRVYMKDGHTTAERLEAPSPPPAP